MICRGLSIRSTRKSFVVSLSFLTGGALINRSNHSNSTLGPSDCGFRVRWAGAEGGRVPQQRRLRGVHGPRGDQPQKGRLRLPSGVRRDQGAVGMGMVSMCCYPVSLPRRVLWWFFCRRPSNLCAHRIRLTNEPNVLGVRNKWNLFLKEALAVLFLSHAPGRKVITSTPLIAEAETVFGATTTRSTFGALVSSCSRCWRDTLPWKRPLFPRTCGVELLV